MSMGLLAVLIIVLMLGLLAIRVPVALALILAGGIGIWAVDDFSVAIATLGRTTFRTATSEVLVVIPLFVLLAAFARHAGLSDRLFAAAVKVFGRAKSGLALATVVGNAALGAITGTSVSNVATLGPITHEEMVKHGYRSSFAGALVASAGTLTVLIPPSLTLVIYALVSGESVGAMILAGVVPGIITTAAFAVVVIIWTRLGRATEPAGPALRKRASVIAPTTPSFRLSPTGAMVQTAIIVLIVVVGLYFGLYTATESAAIAAVAAGLMLLANKRHSLRDLPRAFGTSFSEAVTTTSMLLLLLVGGSVLGFFLVLTRTPQEISNSIVHLDTSPKLVLVLVLLVLILLGSFLDGTTIMLLVTPLVYPALMDGFGMNGVWFGILMVKTIEIGMITPPVGICVYVTAGVIEDLSAEEVFRSVVPFILADVCVIAILFAFPGLVTWLPDLARG